MRLKSLRLVLVVALTLLASFGCRSSEEKLQEEVASASALCLSSDPAGAWSQASERLRVIARTTDAQAVPAPIAAMAQYHLARVHADLLVRTLVVNDQAHLTLLAAELSTQVDGLITEIRTFQLLAQAVLEEVRAVSRNKNLPAESLARLPVFERFLEAVQAVNYRDKRGYLKIAKDLASDTELSYLNDLLAIRDLVWEVMGRTGEGLDSNWQIVSLTVLGRVCEAPSTKLVGLVCSGNPQLPSPLAGKAERGHDHGAHEGDDKGSSTQSEGHKAHADGGHAGSGEAKGHEGHTHASGGAEAKGHGEAAPAGGDEFCKQSLAELDTGLRHAGGAMLAAECTAVIDGKTLTGMEAIRGYYDAAATRLQARKELPPAVKAWLEAHKATMDKAYSEIEKQLFMKP